MQYSKNEYLIYLHYVGFSEVHDEWINYNSERYFREVPEDGEINEIYGDLSMMVKESVN